MTINIRQHNFKVDVGQNRKAWEHINTGLWEPQTFDIIDYFLKKDGTALDLGSWSGVISLYMAHKAKIVYAIDPDPLCFEELQTNIRLNPELAKKIKPHQIAISDKKNIVQLSARKKYGQSSSSILSRSRDCESSIKINTISLSDFIDQESIKQIDFIKMDIEGAEFQILPTLSNLLNELAYPTLYISFHYSYLNEHIYHQYIASKIINKLFLKIEKIFKISFFKKEIQSKTNDLFKHLDVYQYIYTASGSRVSIKHLEKHPEFIKNHDLVFTNKEWN